MQGVTSLEEFFFFFEKSSAVGLRGNWPCQPLSQGLWLLNTTHKIAPKYFLAQYRTDLLATSIPEGGEGLNRVTLIQV